VLILTKAVITQVLRYNMNCKLCVNFNQFIGTLFILLSIHSNLSNKLQSRFIFFLNYV